MPMIAGRQFGRRDLEAHVGRLEQVGGIRRFLVDEGFEKGTETVQVRTGAGLDYYVNPSRGLDISLCEFCGSALSWQSPSGDVHPAFFDADGDRWLRTAAGGLLMTCGLTYLGSPCEDQGRALGLHGRAHHTPARHVSVTGNWQGDEYVMTVAGTVEEMALFGDQIRLTRTVTSRLGGNSIRIDDSVENAGFETAPHMMLYHFNFGFPLLSPDSRLEFPSRTVRPREPDMPLRGYDAWQAPEAGYEERVYYHTDLQTEDRGGRPWTHAAIRNPAFPTPLGSVDLRVELGWCTDTLPQFVEWKMPGQGAHVLGIEPANCFVEGRDVERRRGTLVMLEPGESRHYALELRVDRP